MSLFRVQGPVQAATGAAWQDAADFKVCTSYGELDAYLEPILAEGRPYGSDFEANTLNVWPGARREPEPTLVDWIVSGGPNSARLVPLGHLTDYQYNLDPRRILERMQRLDEAKIPAIIFNGLYELELWQVCLGWEPLYWEDVLPQIHMVNPNERTFGLKDASARILGLTMMEFHELLSKEDLKAGKTFAHLSVTDPKVTRYACPDASNTRMLHFHPQVVAARERQKAIYQLEKAFLPCVRDAMRNGCFLDRAAIDRVAEALGGQVKIKNKVVTPYRGLMAAMRAEVLAALGKDDSFNLNAKGQLGQALVDAGVPIVERTAGGAKGKPQVSTDKKVIGHYGRMVSETTGELLYPIVDKVIRWGELANLDQSYVRKLQEAHDRFGSWVRFPFTQWGAPTGRMSSGGAIEGDGTVNMNVQGITKSDDDAALDVRACFVAMDPAAPDANDWELVSIDFNGFQLRIAANYSREPVWVKAFQEDKSLHQETAKSVYKRDDIPKDSTEYDRGKTGNFTVLFGGVAQTLAATLKIPLKEAEAFFHAYWEALRGLKAWIERTHGHAQREQRVTTIFGRERPLAEYYQSPERWLRLKGDREAVSHIIQGSEADLFKAACARTRTLLIKRGWEDHAKMMLFIHDALVLRVHKDMTSTIVPEIVRVMEGTIGHPSWPVALKVDVKVGPNWGKGAKYYPIERPKVEAPVEAVVERARPAAIVETPTLPGRPTFRAG